MKFNVTCITAAYIEISLLNFHILILLGNTASVTIVQFM